MPIWLILLALVGLIDSAYIFYKKQRGEKLVCLIGKDCAKVVNSRYGSIFGVPNELVGIAYYLAVIALASALYAGTTMAAGIILAGVLLVTAAGALLGSVVLTVLQAWVLREWCEYCLLAAVVNLLLFVLVV